MAERKSPGWTTLKEKKERRKRDKEVKRKDKKNVIVFNFYNYLKLYSIILPTIQWN